MNLFECSRHWTLICLRICDFYVCLIFLLVIEIFDAFIFSFKNRRHLSLTEFVKWILPSCSNIDTLKLYLFEESNDLHKEIARLETLRDLEIGTYNELFPEEVTCVAFRTSTTLLTSSQIIRNCRQVEILRISATITLRDLADLEHFENLKEAHLRWLEVSSVKEALSMLEKCTNLRRITLESETMLSLPTAGELCDFIMEMKHLTFLHIIYCGTHKCYHSKSLVDEVKAFVLLRRPKFEFYVSCCEKFGDFRVPREFFYY
jgi:hypothetical protein